MIIRLIFYSIYSAAFALLLPCCAFSQILITEIQRDPAGAETASPGGASHEFLEITNFGTDTFSIDSLFLSDGVETDSVIPWTDTIPSHRDCIFAASLIPPGRTALILDRDYASAINLVPSSTLPIRPGTVLLTVEDANLGNDLASDDGILLYKGTKSLIVNIIQCAADAPFSGTNPTPGKIRLAPLPSTKEGFSIIPVSFLFDAVRYSLCADSLTPGYYERLRGNWFAEWRLGDLDTVAYDFPCSLACVKSGSIPDAPLEWRVSLQSSSGSAIAAQGRFTLADNHGTAVGFLPLDSAAYILYITENGIETEWPLDVSVLWTPASPVKISELFPRGNSGEPEWFELVNTSPMPLNLVNWTFGNSEGSDTLSPQELVLQPGAYLVVTADAALWSARYPAKNRVVGPPRWHSLDNYNDTLCLWDAKKRLKERICYRSAWFTEWSSQSLERVGLTSSGMDAASWVLATTPTPGQPNSNTQWRSGTAPRLTIGPLPFTPNGDGKNDLLSITIELPANASASLSIYGFSGNKLRVFPAPLANQQFWDGKLDNGATAPLGPFFAVMEVSSLSGKTIIKKKGVLWR